MFHAKPTGETSFTVLRPSFDKLRMTCRTVLAYAQNAVLSEAEGRFEGSEDDESKGVTALETTLSDLEKGLILGLLIAQGHFGGDGKQPQITLKMHVRHERLLMWLNDRIRWSRLYGPYHHAGRDYFQLMIRGPALREEIVPLLRAMPWEEVDDHSHARFLMMLERYGIAADVILSPSKDLSPRCST